MRFFAGFFIVAGFFFTFAAAVGVLRLPDFYTRLHASGKADTLGIALTLVGLAIYNGFSLVSVKIIIISVLIMLANPIGTHVLARAAYRSGVKAWTRKEEES